MQILYVFYGHHTSPDTGLVALPSDTRTKQKPIISILPPSCHRTERNGTKRDGT